MTTRRVLAILCVPLLTLGLASCSSGGSGGEKSSEPSKAGKSSAPDGAEMFPDVTKVDVSGSSGSLSFAVTMTSPYDTAERYADSMRVRSVDGDKVYGERKLDHDHATEQPFTRSIDDVNIPDGVTEVVVEGHDQVSGWGGMTQTVSIP